LEPSPGYALLEPPPTRGQRIAACWRWCCRRALRLWLRVLTGPALLAVGGVQRRRGPGGVSGAVGV
ncbi:MAG: hypothetical protein ACK5YC_02850, partial [Planctomyces sp.]